MRSSRNLPITLVYWVVCLLAISYVVSQMGVVSPWSHPFRLTASVTDSSGLLANNEVTINGTKVGHVESVVPHGDHADVSMVLDSGTPVIHQDASAAIRKKNLLGETYIDVDRGSSPTAMRSGATIAVARTTSPQEIDQVLAIFDPTTQERLKLLINALGDATANNGDTLNGQAATVNQLSTQLNGPAAELSARQQQLDAIVMELQRLYGVLAKQRDQVRQEFGTWNQVMGQLAAQEGQIGGTLQQADTLLQSLDTLVTGEVPTLRATLQDLPTALQSTNAFLGQTNTTLDNLVPVRRSVHDIFLHLGSSFADTDVHGQHFWSVFSVNCVLGCGAQQVSEGARNGAPPAQAASLWSTLGGSG